MKNISIWEDNSSKKPRFKELTEDIKTDVLIIGGGITGVSAYHHLKDSNLKVVLVEQGKLGMSTTSKSTGKLTFLQNDLLDKIRNSVGDEKAGKYLKSQIEAINKIVNIIKERKIKCDLEEIDSMVYTNKNSEIEELNDLKDFLIKNKIKVTNGKCSLINSLKILKVNKTYVFHPVKFVYSLINKSDNIYEDTAIVKIKEDNGLYKCYTNHHVIETQWIIIASHYPYFNLPFLFPVKAYIEKSYLSASIYPNDKLSLISYSYPFISMRTYKNYLIYLSNSHPLAKNLNIEQNFRELTKKLDQLNLKPDYLWSNSDIMTNDGMPYIGEIKNKLLIATGYNTWGLASSFLAGEILRDIILDNHNDYIELFNPSRINIDQILGVIPNTIKSINGYIDGLKKQKELKYYKKTVAYQGKIVLKKCPHLGCGLVFNKIENTYDCPCHGSRFKIDGTCIQSPANKSISIDTPFN